MSIALNKYETSSVLVFLLAFSMPLADQLSTIAMLLVAAFLIYQRLTDREIKWGTLFAKHRFLILLPSLLLLIRLLGALNPSLEAAEWEYVLRALPFLIIPLLGFALAANPKCSVISNTFFYGLLTGTLLVLFICEANVAYEMITKAEPLEYLFRWRHLNIQLTEIVGIHPPYLGTMVAVLIIWLFVEKPKYHKILQLVLLLFLFQLLARNAVVYLLLLGAVYCVVNRKYNYILLFISFSILAYVLIQNHPSGYLKSKIDSVLVIDKPQNRFVRLEASWSTFLEYPLLGSGKHKSQERRRYYYGLMDDQKALEQDLNAHNQYMEYLSTYGIFGFATFMVVLIYYLLLLLKTRDFQMFLLIFGAFLFAFLTESMLERSMGIKFFSFVMAIIIFNRIRLETQAATKIS